MNTLTLNTDKTFQKFTTFGVSGAWWAQVNGGWNETDEASGLPKNERIAQLLFDKGKGIGVSCYRFNLGGGSMESGKGKFSEECRRAECFESDTGYDWSKDANAVKMMRLAVKDGADEVILFVNSPIERLTKNHKAHLDKAGKTNLAKENYSAFAKYVLDCAEHFIAEGIPVKYISPVNEPVWVWNGGQEGCHYRPHQVYAVMKTFAEEMDRRPALRDVKLSGAENGDLRWFNNTYCHVMLDDKTIRNRIDAVDTHSYCVTPDIPIIGDFLKKRTLFMKRYRLFMDHHYPGVDLKTSEWCHMQGGRDFGMNSALEKAKIMMEDIKILRVTSWQLWIAVSNVDYCDGLIYSFDDERRFELTKRYFAFGNFSKFIENGSVRFDTDAGPGLDSVGFIKDGKKVIVVTNRYDFTRTLRVPEELKTAFITSGTQNLEETAVNGIITLPAKSVTTFIG